MKQPPLLILIVAFFGLLLGLATSPEVRAQAPKSAKKNQNRKAPAQPVKPKSLLPTQATTTEVEVAPVRASMKEPAIRAARTIDTLVGMQLRRAGVSPHEMTTDEQFVRRVFLDIVGTIPTATDVKLFLESRDDDKRQKLIDRLLGKPGYASHFYNYWADILRIVDRVDNNTYLRPYGEWVKQQLRDNTRWDKMVHEMLVAEGKVWENPAVGFMLRDQDMPLDNLNNMVRTFLGTRIGCAQCHDHPFDHWTQKEFYQLAAFVGGTEYRVDRQRGYKLNDKQLLSSSPGMQSIEYRQGRNILRWNRMGLWDNPKKELKFPHDYRYDDAKPEEVVQASVLFGTPVLGYEPGERRKVLADWVTGQSNDRFSMTIANRLWQRALGVGLFEPVDEIMDDTKASNPALMTFLMREMQRVDFDLKEFQRVIYYSDTYQRQATYDDLDPSQEYHFPGPILRRMTAEQVWDSLLTLTLPDPDAILRPSDAGYTAILDISEKSTVQEVASKARELDAWIKQDRAETNKRMYRNPKAVGNDRVELARASELPQPLPEGHFLREFGQSDRDIISDSHTDGTVPQLLTMFNGPVTHMMLEPGSVIVDTVMAKTSMVDRVRLMFLTILSRSPTEEEEALALREMRSTLAEKEYKYAGHGNVLWALLNTREFLFIQ